LEVIALSSPLRRLKPAVNKVMSLRDFYRLKRRSEDAIAVRLRRYIAIIQSSEGAEAIG